MNRPMLAFMRGIAVGLLIACTAILIASGCAYRSVEVMVYEATKKDQQLEPDADLQNLLDEAGATLGFEIRPVQVSGLRLELIHTADYVRGRNHRPFLCIQYTRSTYDAGVLAHELGHMLGLPHHPDRNNFMHLGTRGREVTPDQRRTMKRTAILLEGLCWHRE